MNETSKYYVKVAIHDAPYFEKHLTTNGAEWTHMHEGFGGVMTAYSMYAVTMNTQQELSLRLSFPLLGCMNFQKTLGRQIKAKTATIEQEEPL